jgi:hypothetical protein
VEGVRDQMWRRCRWQGAKAPLELATASFRNAASGVGSAFGCVRLLPRRLLALLRGFEAVHAVFVDDATGLTDELFLNDLLV